MASLLELIINGTGELGEITAIGVSNSAATNSAPVDGHAQVATINISGRTTKTSHFLNDNQVLIRDINGLGEIEGQIDTVNVTGNTTTISGPTTLSRFITGNIAIPSVRSGSAVGALELAMQLTGERRVSNVYDQGESANTVIYTMNGYGAGFDLNGNIINPADGTRLGIRDYEGTDIVIPVELSAGPPIFQSPWKSPTTNKIYALQGEVSNRLGLLDLSSGMDQGILAFYYPVDDPSQQEFRIYVGLSDLLGPGAETVTAWDIDPVGGTVQVIITAAEEPANLTINTSTLTDDEWLISTAWNYNSDINELSLTVKISNSDGTGTVTGSATVTAYVSQPILNYGPSRGESVVAGLPTMRMVKTDTIPVSWTGWENPYELPTAIITSLPNNIEASPIQNYNGDVWSYLNEVCVGTRSELAVVNNTIVQRPIGTLELSIDDIIEKPTLTPVSTKAESVKLEWFEYVDSDGTNIYEVPTVYTVGVNEISKIIIQTDNSFTWLPQPMPREVTLMLPPSTMDGYAVSGSDNLPVVPSQWVDYGGALLVSPTDVEGEIELTLVGPRTEIPGVSAPYKFAASDGSNEYPLIRLPFFGTQFAPMQEVVSKTGASPSVTTQIEPPVFRNVCATSQGSIWPLIAKAAKRYAGPLTTITFSMPTRKLGGFGLVEGSIFTYNNNKFRVTQVNYGISVTSVTGVQYATYADVEGVWNGKTYAEVEAFWSNDAYSYADVSVAPLTTEW